MTNDSADGRPGSGERIASEDIARAVTAGELIYEDGSTQVFEGDGRTRYIERGRPTDGEWYVDEDGRFCSFWPPSYRACYELRWVVESGEHVGVAFRDVEHRAESVGRYRRA